MKARFANTADLLLPGQFVNVRLTLRTLSKAITIPAAAVNVGPNGTFAYVVGANQRVAVQPTHKTYIRRPLSMPTSAVDHR